LLPPLEHRADFSVFWSFTDGRTLLTGDQLVAKPLPKHRTTWTQKNAHTHQSSMPWLGFELTIPASKRAKTVHALDCSATVTVMNTLETKISWVAWNVMHIFQSHSLDIKENLFICEPQIVLLFMLAVQLIYMSPLLPTKSSRTWISRSSLRIFHRSSLKSRSTNLSKINDYKILIMFLLSFERKLQTVS
jgi:hypothetical protein